MDNGSIEVIYNLVGGKRGNVLVLVLRVSLFHLFPRFFIIVYLLQTATHNPAPFLPPRYTLTLTLS